MIRELQQKPAPGKPNKPFDPVAFALRRGGFILLAGFLLFALLAPFAWLLDNPYYHTGGSLLIRPEIKQFLTREVDTIQGNFNDYARTQVQRLKTDDVLVQALTSLPREQWPDFLSPDMDPAIAAGILRKRLNVDHVSRTHLLFIGISSESPNGLAETLNATMDAYVAKLQREQDDRTVRRLAYLQEEKKRIDTRIQEKKNELAGFAARLSSNTFNDLFNSDYNRLNLVQEFYLRAREKALQEKALLDKAKRDRETLSSQDLEVFAREAVASNEALYLINNWTYQELQNLRKSIDGLTPSNPDRIVVEERMQAMRDYLQSFETEIYQNALAILREKRSTELNAEVLKAESAWRAAESLHHNLAEQLDIARDEYESSSGILANGKETSQDLLRLRDRMAVIQDRISEVYLEAKAPVRVGIEERARSPLHPAGSSRKKLLFMAFVFAFGVLGSAVLAYDFLDGRIRQDKELRAAIGGKTVEPIPTFPDRERFLHCLDSAPRHSSSLALKSLVVRLNHERNRHRSRTFLFSGADHGAGTTTLAENAAKAFSFYCPKTLLIRLQPGSGDLRPRKFHEIPTILQAVHSSTLGEPSRLCLPLESIENADRKWLPALLDQALRIWDAVFFDAPPLNRYEISRLLATTCDVGILVTRERQSLYHEAYKAFELLVESSIPAATAILNDASPTPVARLLQWKDQSVQTASNWIRNPRRGAKKRPADPPRTGTATWSHAPWSGSRAPFN